MCDEEDETDLNLVLKVCCAVLSAMFRDQACPMYASDLAHAKPACAALMAAAENASAACLPTAFPMQCGNCHLFVHMNCYGVAEPPNGQLWLCDVCTLGLSAPPPCVLCPGEGLRGHPSVALVADYVHIHAAARAQLCLLSLTQHAPCHPPAFHCLSGGRRAAAH